MGGAAGGPVPFHGIDGVDDGELGRYRLGQFKKHPGKIGKLVPAVMKLGLFQPGDHAEQVLDSAGISGHCMSFQLADIDHIVRLHNGRDDVEGMVGKPLRAVHGPGGKIHIELHLRLQLSHAAGAVNIFHVFGVIEPSGALRKGDVRYALVIQPADHTLDHQRMGGYRVLRLFRHDEVGLNHNL